LLIMIGAFKLTLNRLASHGNARLRLRHSGDVIENALNRR